MVGYCVASGCKNEQDGRKILSFHCFPFKRPEILKLWIQAVHRENWTPSKFSKLCGEHFLPTDYLVKPGLTAKLLKPNAVPSVFHWSNELLPKIVEPHRIQELNVSVEVLNENASECILSSMDIDLPSTSTSIAQFPKLINCEIQAYSVKSDVTAKLLKQDDVSSVILSPKYLLPKVAEPHRVQKLDVSTNVLNKDTSKCTLSPMDIDLPSTSTPIAQVPKLIDCETQTKYSQTVSFKKESQLHRKVKTLNQKVRRRDLQILNMKNVIKNMKILKQRVRRRDLQISNMKNVIRSIFESGFSNENLDEILKIHFEDKNY